MLALATVGTIVTFGASSVRTRIEQGSQTGQAERRAAELDAYIAELEGNIDLRSSEAGVRQEALCFGPYVEPGTEVYAVVGVQGCVSGTPGR